MSDTPMTREQDEVTQAAERLLNEVALHRAMALPSEGESFTDDVELVARSVASLRSEMERLEGERDEKRYRCDECGRVFRIGVIMNGCAAHPDASSTEVEDG